MDGFHEKVSFSSDQKDEKEKGGAGRTCCMCKGPGVGTGMHEAAKEQPRSQAGSKSGQEGKTQAGNVELRQGSRGQELDKADRQHHRQALLGHSWRQHESGHGGSPHSACTGILLFTEHG